jgi:hypothetical protein
MARPAAAPHGPNHCGDLLRSPCSNTPTPSPPAEKAAARQDQTGKSSAGDGSGNRWYGIDGHIVEIDTAVKSTCEIVDCQFSQRRVCDEGLGEESVVREGIGVGMRNGVAEKRIVRTVYHRDGR